MNKNIIEFKIITLGQSGVGKTSIIKRYVLNKFEDNLISTIGMEFSHKEIVLKNNETIRLKLMDTSGQERFRSLSKSYFKNAQGVFFVFALNNEDSFKDLEEWIDEFKNKKNLENTIQYLVGNKSDLSNKNINESSIKQFQNKYNMEYYETSAKDNINIDKLFQDIGQTLFDKYKNSAASKGTQLKSENVNNNKNINCCQKTISGDL